MSDPELLIRTMTLAEVDLALDWAAAEGWNPGVHDAAPFYAADPGGFLIGLLGDEPVAVISAVKYGDAFGFLGLYIVKPDHRGRRHGFKIWQEALARLAGRNIGLDGVVEQQQRYRRSGFRLAHRNVRYQGTGGPVLTVLPGNTQLKPLASLPFEDVLAYDRAFFPTERSAFLRAWIAQPHTVALGLLCDKGIVGYGVLRDCRSGHKIGPLFANSPVVAEALLNALGARAGEGAPIFLDVPACNPAAVALAERYGMTAVFETARMYTGPVPNLALHRTYGITSFELG